MTTRHTARVESVISWSGPRRLAPQRVQEIDAFFF
jgi:hypothetical protein